MLIRVLCIPRIFGLLISLFLFNGMSTAQNKINWVSFEDALELQKQAPRKILIDLYTDWCGWCKQMDNTTFSNPVIIEYINSNYIPVKFNAEQKEAIEFKGRTYEFVKQGKRGYHDLAVSLTNGQLSYPTYIFMNENMEVIQPVPGFQDEVQFEMIINYFGNDSYKSISWNKFKEDFKPKNRNRSASKNGYRQP